MMKPAITILSIGSATGVAICVVVYLAFAWLYGVCSHACDYDDSCYQQVDNMTFVIKRDVGPIGFSTRTVGRGATLAEAWASAREECEVSR